MNVQLIVNGVVLRARKGDFLLDVCRNNGIRISTLCSLTGFPPTGACRLCVVEIEGYDDLVPACSFPVIEGLVVKTHSARVIRARKTIVELLLSSHPDDCMFCLRSSYCELQELAEELSVNERNIRSIIKPRKIDSSSNALTHYPGKCILCGRCILVCDGLQVSALEFVHRGAKMEVGTVGGKGLNKSSCISCGQCLQVCPTGSLQEKNEVEELLTFVQNPGISASALVDPAIITAISEELGLRPGKDISGYLISALKTMGFEKVYSGVEAVELSLAQTASSWKEITNATNESWYMTSSCAAWTHYIEQLRPEWINNLIPANTPLMSFARVFKNLSAGKVIQSKKSPKLVYFTSCLASKDEIYRPNRLVDGKPIVDLVLTTRELMQLMRLFGIQLESLSPTAADRLVKGLSYSSHLSSLSGGYLESLYRIFTATGIAKDDKEIEKLRGPKTLRQAEVIINGRSQTWIATSNIPEAINKIKMIERGKVHPFLIEVMACPSGCISGGGQPVKGIIKALKNRAKDIYHKDSGQSRLHPDTYAGYERMVENLDKVKFNFREVYV